MTAAASPAGWYPDPSGAPGQRYFDGTQWTQHHSPAAARLSHEERVDLLNEALGREISQRRGRVESRTPYQVVIVYGSKLEVGHLVFAWLTVLTCGLFLIPWLIVAAIRRETRRTLQVDPYGGVTLT